MTADTDPAGSRRTVVLAVRGYALLLGLIGLALLLGGVKLVQLGGSAYYLIAGATLAATATLAWRRDNRALGLYALLLLATTAWALWEVGFSGWALAPRLVAPALMALPLLFWKAGWRVRSLLALSIAAALISVASSLPDRPHGGPTAVSAQGQTADAAQSGEWKHYGNDSHGTRFSPLSEITAQNVALLQPAWTYRTGVKQTGTLSPMSATPLMVGGRLFLCTQTNIVIALDPDSGAELWRFDPKVDPTGASLVTTCRGVAYFEAPTAKDCPARIITTTFDARLIALNATDGRPCQSFGDHGTVDLKQGLGEVGPGFYYASSAPTIVRGNIVLGGWVADNVKVDEPSGVIRAFDALKGRFAWAWDMGRPGNNGQPGPGERFTRGTPNSWAPMSADDELGLVFVPTGNATPDHWGGKRTPEMDRYSSSIVALDANTGKVRWSFQTVHHDVWDYDVASQPSLVDLPVSGRIVKALIQPTKTGQLYLLDRTTGRALAKVDERAVPQGASPGDRLSPTQPYSAGMPDVAAGPSLREADMWGITPLDQLWCRVRFRSDRYDGPFTPVGERRSIIYPGVGGGVNWGSAAVDPERRLLVVNSIRVPTEAQLIPRKEADRLSSDGFHVSLSMQQGTPYAVRITTFMSPLGIPCNQPPYGLLTLISLDSRKVVWSQPLGTGRDSGPLGFSSHLPLTMGVPNFGGSLITRGGLVFIGATQERAFRAIDLRTGAELWQARLPAGGQATPMTYVSPRTRRQYVVIVAGGSVLMQSKLGDYVKAYALPARR